VRNGGRLAGSQRNALGTGDSGAAWTMQRWHRRCRSERHPFAWRCQDSRGWPAAGRPVL